MSSAQQDLHLGWMAEMASTIKSAAPNQLVAAATEGFFFGGDNVKYNSGAGAQCEGEV